VVASVSDALGWSHTAFNTSSALVLVQCIPLDSGDSRRQLRVPQPPRHVPNCGQDPLAAIGRHGLVGVLIEERRIEVIEIGREDRDRVRGFLESSCRRQRRMPARAGAEVITLDGQQLRQACGRDGCVWPLYWLPLRRESCGNEGRAP
jgi:hypothetical protein